MTGHIHRSMAVDAEYVEQARDIVTRTLARDLLLATSDGREYVVTVGRERVTPEQGGSVTVVRTACVALLHASDAAVGEYAYKDTFEAEPGEHTISGTTWQRTSAGWQRKA